MRFLFVLVSVLFLTTSLFANPTIFTVKIADNTEPYLGIWYKKAKNTEATYSRIPLSNPQEFSFELDIKFEQILHFEYADKRFPALVKSGQSLEFSFDGTNILNSLNFKGITATDNNFMAEFQRKFGVKNPVKYDLAYLSFSVAGTVSRQASSHTDKQYFQHRNERKKSAQDFLASKKAIIQPRIFEIYEKQVYYQDLTDRIAYLVINKDRLGLVGILKIKDQYPIPAISNKDAKLLDFPSYQNYLKARLQYEYLPGSYGNARQVAPIIYDLAGTNFTGKATWYLKSEILCTYINRTGDPSLGQERYPVFFKENPYKEYTAKVEKTYGSDLNALTSTPAPLLEAITEDGRNVALQDYQGRVVYVSFWASWCKPCLRNFEKSLDTRKKLQDMGVVLFNVSIDENKEAFYKSLERQSIIGVNALASNTDQTKIAYNLATIPAYYIIDKNGKFAFLSEGSNRDITEEFRVLVEK